MRTFLIAVVALLSCAGANAQKSIVESWKEMPDSILPYLDQESRKQLVSLYDISPEWSKIISSLDEVVTLNKLTDNFIDLSLNELTKMQMALVTTDSNDSILCMVKTYVGGTEEEGRPAESVITFYNMSWQKLDNTQFLAPVKSSELVQKPDTMEVEKYNHLIKLASPKLMMAEMDDKDLSLTLSLTVPMLSEKEREQLAPILLQRKLKWSGKMYK